MSRVGRKGLTLSWRSREDFVAEISLELGLERCGRGHWAEMKHEHSRREDNKKAKNHGKGCLSMIMYIVA